MDLNSLKNQAAEALNNEKVEEVVDQGLDTAADAAKKVTGGKFDDQIDQARDTIDDKLGN